MSDYDLVNKVEHLVEKISRCRCYS